MNNLRRNLHVFYLYKFLSNFRVDNVLWLLYMQFRGLSLLQIGICESILNFSVLILEIPSGAYGDLIGRKASMILGSFLSLGSYIILFFAKDFIGFSLAFALLGAGGAFFTGSDTALIYDTFKSLKIENDFKKASANFMALMLLGGLVSNMTGGLLSRINWSAVYAGAIIARVLSLVITMLLIEPPFEKQKSSFKNYIGLIKQGIDQLINDKLLLWLSVFWISMSLVAATVYFYSQTYFEYRGLSAFHISIVFTIEAVVTIGLAKCSSKIEEILGRKKLLLITSLLFAIPIAIYGYVGTVFAVIILIITSGILNFMDPVMTYYLNSRIDSQHRATTNSALSMIFSVFMIIFFPLFGFIADHIEYKSAFLFTGLCSLLLLGISFAKVKNYDKA